MQQDILQEIDEALKQKSDPIMEYLRNKLNCSILQSQDWTNRYAEIHAKRVESHGTEHDALINAENEILTRRSIIERTIEKQQKKLVNYYHNNYHPAEM